MKCKDCKYWIKTWTTVRNGRSITTGECRINPPVVHQDEDMGLWPITFEDTWCGKFEEVDE